MKQWWLYIITPQVKKILKINQIYLPLNMLLSTTSISRYRTKCKRKVCGNNK